MNRLVLKGKFLFFLICSLFRQSALKYSLVLAMLEEAKNYISLIKN
jgi:hypothetical protein